MTVRRTTEELTEKKKRRMIDYAIAAQRRVARKSWYCDEDRPGCLRTIKRGDVYLEVTVFPGHDAISVDHPVRYVQCAKCAVRNIDLLDPIPYAQCARDGLL